jgi:hypothetical protein
MYTNQLVMRLFATIKQQNELVELQQKQLSSMSERIDGLDIASRIILEILLVQSPQLKSAVADALSQMLVQDDLAARVPNEYCVGFLRSIQEVARNPSRLTPEGRRAWLRVVSPPGSEEPGP